MRIIRVLKAFTEQRTGQHYERGDVVDDPNWDERRVSAYAARGLVEVVEIENVEVGNDEEA